jgi:5-methylcytosine-specific restriction endonuclease McrA
MSEQRLRWGGNLEAQKQADEAFARLRPKRKAKKAPKRKGRKQKLGRCRKPYKRPDGTIDYYLYIASKDWRRKVAGVLKRRGSKCEECGSTHGIQIHHKHYRTLGKESDNDLRVLCGGCHANHHEGYKGIVMDPMTAEFVSMFRR